MRVTFYLRQGGYVFVAVCVSVCKISQKVIDDIEPRLYNMLTT